MNIKYRPEIDGLRAISVCAVILYHLKVNIFNLEFFKGGFIGVDIFFVISGYLITSIILIELKTKHSFSFKNFYERRVRRIIPVMVFVMLASFPFAWKYLLPDSFVDFSKSIIYSLAFSSNFYFPISGQQYGAESAMLKPFLHTWSLSVEEQYYIIFPIILIIIFKYLNKFLIFFFILGFIFSFFLAVIGSVNFPGFNFYLIPSRAWEILTGSILAFYEIKIGKRSQNKIFNLFLPSVGFILIFHSIIFFNDKMLHPSVYTLSPIIGVGLIIWFSNKDEIITKILSSKLFVWVGLISYSLYLWHYPFFAFSRIIDFDLENYLNVALLLFIIFILSTFTYYFVERPARNKNFKFKYLFYILIFFIFLLIFINSNVINNKGYKNRLPDIIKNNYSYKEIVNNFQNNFCENKIINCVSSSNTNEIYLIGDSHMRRLGNVLETKLSKINYPFKMYTRGGCLYFPGFHRIETFSKKIDKKCDNNYFSKIRKILNNKKDSIIIFGGRFPLYLEKTLFNNQEGGIEGYEWDKDFVPVSNYKSIETSFREEILKLAKNNKIILIYPVPEVGLDVNKKIYLQWINRKNKSTKNFDLQTITTSFEVFKKRTNTSFELLNSIKNENILRIYPHNLFCNKQIKNRCVANNHEFIFYADDDHLSNFGNEMLSNKIINKILKIQAE